MNPTDPSTRTRKIGLLIVLCVAVFVLVLIVSMTQTTRQQPTSVSVDRKAQSDIPAQPPSYPPLQIQSSGRLPQQIQRLHLGMTLAEALAVEPGL